MQQQPPQVMTMMPSFPPTNITTEQIQKYLDENKKLILAILDNQNLGKLAECAQYQAVLQKNLMYLAAIADAQPPAAQASPQMPTHPAMQQGAHFMQHPQAAAIAQQQAGTFAQNTAMHFNPHQQEHHQQQQHQQLHQQHQQAAMHSHMVMRPGGPNNGMHMMHGEASLGGGGNSGAPPSSTGPSEFSRGTGPGASSSSLDARGGSKPEVEAGSNDGQGNSPAAGNADDN